MAFLKKIWKDRISEYPTRRQLTKENGDVELVTVARSEGTVSQEGDALSAENLNDLEERIADGFGEVNSNLGLIGRRWLMTRNDVSFSASTATQHIYLTGAEENESTDMYAISSNTLQIKKAGIYNVYFYLHTNAAPTSAYRTWIKVQDSSNGADWLDLGMQYGYASGGDNQFITLSCVAVKKTANSYIRFMGTTSDATKCAVTLKVCYAGR